MRTLNTIVLLATAVLLIAAMPTGAQVPTKMNYQVMLTDGSDQALVDQAVQIVFRLYTAPVGGTLEWTETHNTTTNHIGVVSLVLGETTPLQTGDFGQPLWLEVEVGGESLTPRRELVSSAYALHSYDSDYLGGVQAADYTPRRRPRRRGRRTLARRVRRKPRQSGLRRCRGRGRNRNHHTE